jgi:hypothetical protein
LAARDSRIAETKQNTMQNKPSITLITVAVAVPFLAFAFGFSWLAAFIAASLLSFAWFRPRRLKWRVAALAVLCLTPLLASAATTGTSTAATSPPSPNWLSALIPILVPISIAGLKLVLPKLPTWTLPAIVAPLLGTLADLALHYAGVPTLGPAWGAILGSAGVGLREIQDQVKQQLASTPTNS